MRITDKILNSFVDSIDTKTGNNSVTWTTTENEFVNLLQVTNNGGSVTEICSSCTKKELYYFMRGFLEGCK